MVSNRSEFTAKTKELLCIGVCGHCSICGVCTTWVDETKGKKENIGEAAHIEAAAKGGPRFNPNQTDEQRSSLYNGIWLCSNCHTKIDSNEEYYTVSLLHFYKRRTIANAQKMQHDSLQGEGLVQVHDFTRSMLSFFSMIYGYRESLHNCIRAIKKYTDGFFQEFQSEEMFYTQYAFEADCGGYTLLKNLQAIKNDLWDNRLNPLLNSIKEGRLYILDSYELEKKYLGIIGNCPVSDEDWWRFFIHIKNHFEELENTNTHLLNEYKTQYNTYHEGI